MLAQLMSNSTPDNAMQFDVAKLLSRLGQRSGLALDSRKIQPGDVFVAIPGMQEHGLVHARQAIEHGASAIIYDPAAGGAELAQELASENMISVTFMEQPHLRDHIGLLAGSFYHQPSHQLDVVGITGTNGKTSCSHFISQAMSAVNQRNTSNNNEYKHCGYIGTLGWGIPGNNQLTTNTTPDAIELNKILATLADREVDTVAMEVSSHGLVQNRLQGIKIAGAVFTNLGRDHLDYHQSAENYLNAKLQLFRSPDLRFAVINQDDPASQMVSDALANDVQVIGFAMHKTSHLNADLLTINDIHCNQNNTTFQVFFRGQCALAKLPLIGEFNIANGLATVGVMLGLGIEFTVAVKALRYLTAVAGRMDQINNEHDEISVYVDYAHSPDALTVALQTVHQHCTAKVWVVFGCGGNRDQGKREQMGEIASHLADHVILTDDNPRDEDGEKIINDILEGCLEQPAQIIRDRSIAIETAILAANPGDSVLIAGKGHEVTQEINGEIVPCDDRQITQSALKKRRNRHQTKYTTTAER
jgi:UDP-N-acetylmuramoyl-L-alanyl-D-glutamate--2,6-diaminopimelate ligase